MAEVLVLATSVYYWARQVNARIAAAAVDVNLSVIWRPCYHATCWVDGLPKTLDRLKGKGKTLRTLDCKPGRTTINIIIIIVIGIIEHDTFIIIIVIILCFHFHIIAMI